MIEENGTVTDEDNRRSSIDETNFPKFVETYEVSLVGFLCWLGFSEQDAKDLMQETLIKAWVNRGSYDPCKGRLTTWVWTIARNVAMSQRKRLGRRLEATACSLDVLLEEGRETELDQGGSEPQLETDHSAIKHALHDFSKTLTPLLKDLLDIRIKLWENGDAKITQGKVRRALAERRCVPVSEVPLNQVKGGQERISPHSQYPRDSFLPPLLILCRKNSHSFPRMKKVRLW
ncbi:MAG: RNA polymerase sigma factor [Candidatus Liptonbacteria bacterium]|nr:RNA polymerase sigma factor [Candidatus Liptonbacteria bacterium]